MHPCAKEVGGGVDLDYSCAGAPEFLGNRLGQRVVTADDDFAVELKDFAHVAWLFRDTKLDRDKLADVKLPCLTRLFVIRLRLCVVRHEYSDFG
jgi:hypothetical protein